MGIEIERRFLISREDWRNLVVDKQLLRQGYLAITSDGLTVRFRISGQGKAWLTVKSPAEGIARHEFEYLIPVSDAEALWELTPHRLIKTRYELNIGPADWVVDCFEGENASLSIAEVELCNAEEIVQIPEWCGKEVTGEFQLSNAALARTPLACWPSDRRRDLGV